MAQRVLGIPLEQITIHDADTSRTPNAPPTGGSQGSDVFGLAVKVSQAVSQSVKVSQTNQSSTLQNACEELIKTLEPYKKANESGGWPAWVGAAYADRQPLSVVGHGVLVTFMIFFKCTPLNFVSFIFRPLSLLCTCIQAVT